MQKGHTIVKEPANSLVEGQTGIITISNTVLLSTNMALSPYKVYDISTLLVLNGTSLNCVSTLLVLSRRIQVCYNRIECFQATWLSLIRLQYQNRTLLWLSIIVKVCIIQGTTRKVSTNKHNVLAVIINFVKIVQTFYMKM